MTLPGLVAGAGYTGRGRVTASSSRSIRTQSQSLEPSTSQDRDPLTADPNLAWNVFDFGVSHGNAHQNAARTLIAQERRRKVIHSIIQDVRAALRRDLAFAEVNNAFGQVCAAIGADPLQRELETLDIGAVAAAIRDTERDWARGFFVPPGQPRLSLAR